MGFEEFLKFYDINLNYVNVPFLVRGLHIIIVIPI